MQNSSNSLTGADAEGAAAFGGGVAAAGLEAAAFGCRNIQAISSSCKSTIIVPGQ